MTICLLLSLLLFGEVQCEYREPLSLLQMGPDLYKAAEDFLAQKELEKLSSQVLNKRRWLQSDTDDQIDDGIDEDDSEVADMGDDEENIDPSEMPDSWDTRDDDEFLDPIKDESSECVRTLMDLTNNFLSYNNTLMHIFRNSGKDYNDFGRYEDCNEIHHFNYFMVTVLKKFPIPFTMGLCLPAECQLEDLNEFKPFMTKAINAALPNMFEGVQGFTVVPTVEESDVQFVDPKVENAKVVEYTFVSILSISIIAFFCAMTCIATTKLWSENREFNRL